MASQYQHAQNQIAGDSRSQVFEGMTTDKSADAEDLSIKRLKQFRHSIKRYHREHIRTSRVTRWQQQA
jgi:hypothetical protein